MAPMKKEVKNKRNPHEPIDPKVYPREMYDPTAGIPKGPCTMDDILKMRPADCLDDPWYEPGDVVKSMIPPKDYFVPITDEELLRNVKGPQPNPLHEKGIKYKSFCDAKSKAALTAAILKGDMELIRKLATLSNGEDGLEINLNVSHERKEDSLRNEGAINLGKSGILSQPGIKSLILCCGKCWIEDEGIKELCGSLPKAGNGLWDLKLYLFGNDFTDEGMKWVAAGIPQDLKQLHFGAGACKFADDGVDHLLAAVPDSIEGWHCHLRWNDFDDEGRWVREKVDAKARALPNLDLGTLKVPGRFWMLV